MNKEDLPALLNTPNYEPERAGGGTGKGTPEQTGGMPNWYNFKNNS